MLFRSNLNERKISILAFVISFSFHTAVFGLIGSHGGWKAESIGSGEPVPIELVAVKKEEPIKEPEPPKIEEPVPPPNENPDEQIVERELEKTVSRPVPPPPPKKEAKKAKLTEKKGQTPRISPLIAKKYSQPDSDGMTVPPIPGEKLENAPPAVIPEPVMGKALGTGTGAAEDTTGTIKELAFGGNQGPSFKNMVKPEYPEFARRTGQESYVLLKVLVDETGRARKVEVIKSGGRAFDEAAIEAIKRSSFYPARDKGVPIPCYVKIPIRFQLVQK
ncbi:MAG: energy transducer TonB [Thermodesulforhabdaceae bacterium]